MSATNASRARALRRADSKRAYNARVNAALDRIAANIDNGDLMLASDQPAFFEAVADKLEAAPRVTT